MTPVGHSLFGATIAVAFLPSAMSRRTKALMIASFVALANIPDARLSGWGHHRYDISHSVFVNAMLITLCAILLACWPRVRRLTGGPSIIVAGAGAWLSHLLLDSFYNHGLGLAAFWPFSKARFALPIPWLDNLHYPLPHVDAHAASVLGIELVTFGSTLALVWISRRFLKRNAGRWVQRGCHPEHPSG